jgi:hypothetical protein
MNLKKLFLYSLIISVAVSALIGIGVVLFGNFGEFEAKILLTNFTVTCLSILGLACGAYYETRRGRMLPVSGILMSVVSAVLCVYVIWKWNTISDDLGKTTLTTSILATVFAHLSLISIARLDLRFKWSLYLLYLADAILSIIFLSLIWFEPNFDSGTLSKVIGVLTISIAALTIMTPVFHRLSFKATAIEDIDTQIAKLRARIEELERQKARRRKPYPRSRGPLCSHLAFSHRPHLSLCHRNRPAL